MTTNNTQSTNTTTIRVDEKIKQELANLDFVKKDTYNQILLKLIEFYDKNKKRGKIKGG